MIMGLEHVALSVSNLDRSIDFYCNTMGLELIRIIECNAEMRLGDVVGIPGCIARIAHLRSGEFMLELFEYLNPRGKPIPGDFKQADNGYTHIGFKSTDVRKDFQLMKKRGISFIGEPVEFRPGVWIVYFYGPDGEVCELRQT
jgi:catechol 2,3-dioxygenase-like lactoylglutathione lyase family enzyme